MDAHAVAFLDEERDAWRPFEALADLTDEQLSAPVAGAHGWSGRQLIGHLLSGHELVLAVATELAVNETSTAKEVADADWEARGGDVVNAEIDAVWAALSMDELRDRFATLPGELRRSLTVVPESRWLEPGDHQRFFRSETTVHYADHVADLAAILASAGR
jgi:Mycothiol maleylpyruvate isomerase N-terminal domain